MSSKRTLAIIFVISMSAVVGCMDEPARVVAPDGADPAVVAGGGIDGSGGGGSRVASGHFTRQNVEVTDQDGSRFTASFRADFNVFSDGRANGNFSLFSEAGMTQYRITGAEVVCEGGLDVVVLSGTVKELGSGGPDTRNEIFTATLMPVDADNPECIIWDIKDSCSHEAEGKYDVLQSACPR